MKKGIKEQGQITCLIAGFSIGLILIIIYYFSLFNFAEKSFTFQSLLDFHSKNPFSLVFDILPILFLGIAFLFIKYREKQETLFKQQIQKKSEENSEAILIAKELAEGKFNSSSSSPKSNNELISSLELLKLTLFSNKEAQNKRKKEDQQRNHISEGLAMFGDILRKNSNDLQSLSYELIKILIRFLDANQGGFFLSETNSKEKKYLNLLACYAYDRKKFTNKHIKWGDGLIGTCAIEQKSIYMTDIPDSYLTITSGLGKSNPRNLLIIPLIHNNETKGIIELSSFKTFKEDEIDFAEKIAESVAMTIENILNSDRTKQLLEETQVQTEELSIQEEKMRQSMEELKATQEQAARQAEKFINFTNSVNHTMIRAEYDIDGVLLYANTKFLKKLGYSGNREVEGKHISIFINEKDKLWFNDIWHSLSHGGAHFEGYMKHITKQGQDLWTMATYTCIRNEEGGVEKVLFLAIDTTEHKKQSLDYEGQIEAINRLSLKAEFSPDGKLISSNSLFKNTLKFDESEFLQMNIYDFINRKEIETLSETWAKVIRGKAFQGQIRLYTKHKEEKWFRATFISVNDMYNEVSKVIFMANEISNEKIMENENRKQNETLKEKEEKFRIENFELTKNLKSLEHTTINKIDTLKTYHSALDQLLDMEDDIGIIVNNSGILLYLNNKAEQFFNCKKKDFINKAAISIIKRKNYPTSTGFIKTLFDPAQTKIFDKKNIEMVDYQGNKKYFKLKSSNFEINGEIIYLVLLSKTKDI